MLIGILCSSSASSLVQPFSSISLAEYYNYTAISEFRVVNRRKLLSCPDPNPYLQISVSPDTAMRNGVYLTVTAQYVSNDPGYLSCQKKMRLTRVSGDNAPQQVQYGNGLSQTSVVSTFTQADMCSSSALPSPAKDLGWHDPGYIHTAVMTGLTPSSTFTYKYESNLVGWSDQIQFKTPPAGGSSSEIHFIAYGDMGKAPLDPSAEYYIQPGSLSVIKAVTDEVNAGNVSSIFHIGDIGYATGFFVEWDFFFHLIQPVDSKVSYMTAIGNHERCSGIGVEHMCLYSDPKGEHLFRFRHNLLWAAAVCRNHLGEILSIRLSSAVGSNPFKGESIDARLALAMAEDFVPYHIIIEGDSLVLVNQVLNPHELPVWCIEGQVVTMRNLLSNHTEWQLLGQ
ncbi:putative inactive purple acid phosphatase 1 [Morella rubra]|uniref:Putative inactive purple acid phosphatase 1 n=1 Tax=Morella rubra TaxID=262757 RepID=A0A6A1VKZ6_9ROSI|nr:putative inactive purple acid phosphatase 1 [Morella rubra]